MFKFSISSIIGYQIANVFSNPKSKAYKKIPLLRLRWIEFLPNLKVHIKGRIIHLHHWLNFTFILIISISTDQGFLSSTLIRGLLTGVILQGFTYPDWKRIIISKER